jgi:hypothetical protein
MHDLAHHSNLVAFLPIVFLINTQGVYPKHLLFMYMSKVLQSHCQALGNGNTKSITPDVDSTSSIAPHIRYRLVYVFRCFEVSDLKTATDRIVEVTRLNGSSFRTLRNLPSGNGSYMELRSPASWNGSWIELSFSVSLWFGSGSGSSSGSASVDFQSESDSGSNSVVDCPKLEGSDAKFDVELFRIILEHQEVSEIRWEWPKHVRLGWPCEGRKAEEHN